jgi:hypothetical protein
MKNIYYRSCFLASGNHVRWKVKIASPFLTFYLFSSFVVYLKTLPVAQDYIASNDRMIHDVCIRKDMEGRHHALISSTILAFAWRD